MVQAVEKNPMALNNVAENMRANHELAIAALSNADSGVLTARMEHPQFIPL